MITYATIIIGCWVIYLLVWAVSAFNVKRDIRGGSGNLWQQFWLLRLVVAAILLLLVAARIATGTEHFTNSRLIFSRVIFPQSTVIGWTDAALSVIGVSFAIWARVHLGRNWSPRPTAKENHELVTTGPYAYVRHPIYTGLLLMALGAALTGSLWGIGVFIFAILLFISRIGREEKIMLELFPEAYPRYQARTKKLIPWVW
jgi:protein-S-isoprenylcysteine O-methyltransferase Ste14